MDTGERRSVPAVSRPDSVNSHGRNFGSACGVYTDTTMPSPRRIAIALILAGVFLYAGSMYWLTTRKPIPLDVPISLSRGHIRTEEFSINLDADYSVEILVEKTPSPGDLECLTGGRNETPATLKTRWVLSNAGQVESSGGSDGANEVSGSFLGIVRLSGGRYRLEIDVLSDTSVLNKGSPRLRLEAGWTGYNRLSQWYNELSIVAGMLVLMGGVWLFLSRAQQNAERSTALGISAAPHLVPQSAGSRREPPLKALFSAAPPFGATAVFVLLPVLIFLWLVPSWRVPPTGILVLTSDRSLKTPRYGQSGKPLVLRIDKENRWFFDGKPVSAEEFPAAFKKALDRRLDWFVYLSASPELPFGAPARAMDMIQGLHAKIILVTPSTEKDCCTGTSNR